MPLPANPNGPRDLWSRLLQKRNTHLNVKQLYAFSKDITPAKMLV
jgi:hypothetical protein